MSNSKIYNPIDFLCAENDFLYNEVLTEEQKEDWIDCDTKEESVSNWITQENRKNIGNCFDLGIGFQEAEQKLDAEQAKLFYDKRYGYETTTTEEKTKENLSSSFTDLETTDDVEMTTVEPKKKRRRVRSHVEFCRDPRNISRTEYVRLRRYCVRSFFGIEGEKKRSYSWVKLYCGNCNKIIEAYPFEPQEGRGNSDWRISTKDAYCRECLKNKGVPVDSITVNRNVARGKRMFQTIKVLEKEGRVKLFLTKKKERLEDKQ